MKIFFPPWVQQQQMQNWTINLSVYVKYVALLNINSLYIPKGMKVLVINLYIYTDIFPFNSFASSPTFSSLSSISPFFIVTFFISPFDIKIASPSILFFVLIFPIIMSFLKTIV